MTVSPAKMAEPVEMPFGTWAEVGPRNYVLDRGPDPPWEGALLRGNDVGVFLHTAEHHFHWP